VTVFVPTVVQDMLVAECFSMVDAQHVHHVCQVKKISESQLVMVLLLDAHSPIVHKQTQPPQITVVEVVLNSIAFNSSQWFDHVFSKNARLIVMELDCTYMTHPHSQCPIHQ